MASPLLHALTLLANELLFFAACGFILFGVDDLIVDLIWLAKRPDRAIEQPNVGEAAEGTIAVLVPAWDEAAVIGAMIERASNAWQFDDYHLFIGTYANDLATQRAAAIVDEKRQTICVLDKFGPTTKADCLNGLYQAILEHERQYQISFAAFVLHDAEDLVDPDELRLYRQHLKSADMIQIPVVPQLDPDSRLVAGHYADEFAESHLKDLPVRQLLGASVPSAGTGTALSRRAAAALAQLKGGFPFDAASLTEDYEMGLALGELGLRGIFVRQKGSNGQLIAVRSHFPPTLGAAIRQKSRWIAGIAFAGWDRTGWRGGLAEHWMRWRDRRSLIAATVIVASYLAIILFGLLPIDDQTVLEADSILLLLYFNLATLIWRLGFRLYATGHTYGWREGVRAAPRLIISNVITVLASFRALNRYVRYILTGRIDWEKTRHIAQVLDQQ